MTVAPYSPTLGNGAPLYLLGTIDPTYFLFFQVVALFIAFDIRHRHARNKIEEVLDSKPPSNLESLLGSTLSVVVLVWIVAALNLAAMYLVGCIAQLFGFPFSEPFQLHSLINLILIDVPAMLFIWVAWFMFLSTVLKYRMLVIVVSLSTVFGWYYFIHMVPFSWLELVATSSNNTLFVSDVLPQLASPTSLAVRLASVLGGLAMLSCGCLFLRRQDPKSNSTMIVLTSSCSALGAAVFGLAWWMTNASIQEAQEWASTHATYENEFSIDIEEISGSVVISPGKRLFLDLEYEFQITEPSMSTTIAFSFNPNMSIDQVYLNGNPANHSFNHGLLEIDYDPGIAEVEDYKMRVVAHGVPDPRFAYLDQDVDYMNDNSYSVQTTILFGRDGSVFDSRYVALMPGVCWYPIPGPINFRHISNKTIDFFDVSLEIELKHRKNWDLIGSATTTTLDETHYAINTQTPITEIGLFATKFQRLATAVNGVDLSIYTHQRHSRNFSLFSNFEELRPGLEQFISAKTRDGKLSLPHSSVALVEVPRRLRTVGGGWKMPDVQTLPGLVLVKEHGFPRAMLDLNVARVDDMEVTDEDLDNLKFEVVGDFFHQGLGTDKGTRKIAKLIMTQSTMATGEHADILNAIMESLVLHSNWTNFAPFSFDATAQIADSTGIHGMTATMGIEDAVEENTTLGTTWSVLGLHYDEIDYTNRYSLQLRSSNHTLAPIPTENFRNYRELTLFKTHRIAEVIWRSNSYSKIIDWISELQTRYRGRTYSHEDLLSLAQEFDLLADPALTTWLTAAELPAYVVSEAIQKEIASDDQGQARYQTSLTIHNESSTKGLVKIQHPTRETVGWNWGQNRIASRYLSIEGKSSIQINLNTDYPIDKIWLETPYSLNPYENLIQLDLNNIERDLDSLPDSFVELVAWEPEENPHEIIVDNLDENFSLIEQVFEQPRHLFGPLRWFHDLEDKRQLDVINSIPICHSWSEQPKNRWCLSPVTDNRYRAYGQYSKSFVTLKARSKSTPKVQFSTQLPATGKWQIYFYEPRVDRILNRDQQYEENRFIAIDIRNNEREVVEFNQPRVELKSGWNMLGTYDLEMGTASVELGNDGEVGSLYVDAVRFRQEEPTESEGL